MVERLFEEQSLTNTWTGCPTEAYRCGHPCDWAGEGMTLHTYANIGIAACQRQAQAKDRLGRRVLSLRRDKLATSVDLS